MEIDWSKAPEGATHYNYYCYYPWLRDGERPACFRNGEWVEYTNPDTGRAHINSEVYSVPRPAAAPAVPAWDGTGLPPAGTVCIVKPHNTQWGFSSVAGHERTVLAYHGEFVWLGQGNMALETTRIDKVDFLPLRTPEQVAAEERKKAIEEMRREIGWTKPQLGPCPVAALYDAGYRKQA